MALLRADELFLLASRAIMRIMGAAGMIPGLQEMRSNPGHSKPLSGSHLGGALTTEAYEGS